MLQGVENCFGNNRPSSSDSLFSSGSVPLIRLWEGHISNCKTGPHAHGMPHVMGGGGVGPWHLSQPSNPYRLQPDYSLAIVTAHSQAGPQPCLAGYNGPGPQLRGTCNYWGATGLAMRGGRQPLHISYD
jgi:hypothetical protein